jgi:short-subunit dehydrogenase
VRTGFGDAAGISDEDATDALPKMMWLPVAEVANAAVSGMDANKAVVIPGMANRIAAAAGWLSPRSAIVPMVARRHPALRS